MNATAVVESIFTYLQDSDTPLVTKLGVLVGICSVLGVVLARRLGIRGPLFPLGAALGAASAPVDGGAGAVSALAADGAPVAGASLVVAGALGQLVSAGVQGLAAGLGHHKKKGS